MATDTTQTKSFMSGLSDIFGSVLEAAPKVITAINTKAPAQSTNEVPKAYDAYGRLPGQPGYGTAQAPTGIQSAPSMFESTPWLKPVLIVGGALLAVLILIRSFGKK